MRDDFPRPEELPYRPSRVKQLAFLAILLVVFVVTTGVALLLWMIEARDFDNIVARTLIHNLKWLVLFVCVALGVVSAVGLPILVIQILVHRPAFTLTSVGIRLAGGVVIAWSEIEEIHEFVDRDAPGPIKQVLLGLYLRDEDAIRARLGVADRWQMGLNKKHGRPPIVVATHHLIESVPEILDTIEDFMAELREQENKKERWPKIYRRKD